MPVNSQAKQWSIRAASRRWLAALLSAALLTGALSACLNTPAADSTPPPATVGIDVPLTAGPTPTGIPTESPFTGYFAPDFTLPDLDGHPVSLHDYRGHPVWLNFWATWCPPCQVEMPEMETLYSQYKSRGLIILGVDVQESADTVRLFVTERHFDWQFLLDSNGLVARRYYMTGLPLHVFIDRSGTIRGLQPGGLDPAGMEPLLQRIMDK